MKTATSKVFKCWKCSVFFYVILYCISGLAVGVFASYLLLTHHNIRQVLGPQRIVLSFLIIPALLTVLSTTVGWKAIKNKNIKFVKFFSVLVAVTAVLEIAGSIWCFFSLQETYDYVLIQMKEKFKITTGDIVSENWWDKVQRELKCCGLHGPIDYSERHAVPFSCCGSDSQGNFKGSCSIIWQEGCSNALAKELSQDIVLLSLVSLLIAFLQIPGVFISWCFANRISREGI